jgi:hypothetical protein
MNISLLHTVDDKEGEKDERERERRREKEKKTYDGQ